MIGDLSAIVHAAADAVSRVEAERDDLAELNDRLVRRVAELEDELPKMLREAYRRGYHTGWSVGRDGRPRETAPERHSRIEICGIKLKEPST